MLTCSLYSQYSFPGELEILSGVISLRQSLWRPKELCFMLSAKIQASQSRECRAIAVPQTEQIATWCLENRTASHPTASGAVLPSTPDKTPGAVLKYPFAHYNQSLHTYTLTFLCSAITETRNVKHLDFKACCTGCCKSLSFVDGVLKVCCQLHFFGAVKCVICMLLTGGSWTLFAVIWILYPTATLLSTFSTLFYILTLLYLHWEVNKFFVQYASVKCSHRRLHLPSYSESPCGLLKGCNCSVAFQLENQTLVSSAAFQLGEQSVWAAQPPLNWPAGWCALSKWMQDLTHQLLWADHCLYMWAGSLSIYFFLPPLFWHPLTFFVLCCDSLPSLLEPNFFPFFCKAVFMAISDTTFFGL